MKALDDVRGLDILSLGVRADEIRRSRPGGGVVTYLRVHPVRPREFGGVLQVPEAAAEVRVYETPDSLEQAIDQVRRLREAAGARRVAAYSLADLEERARGGWGDLGGVLKRLVHAGLNDLAEMPLDRLAEIPASMALLADAGIQPRRLTVARRLGERREELLERACAWAERYALPLRVAPLPRMLAAEAPTTGYEDVRLVALARLAFAGRTHAARVSIEVDWSLYGPKLAQVALSFGADHLDAVPAEAGEALGPRRTPVADVERNIRAAGFEAEEYRPA